MSSLFPRGGESSTTKKAKVVLKNKQENLFETTTKRSETSSRRKRKEIKKVKKKINKKKKVDVTYDRDLELSFDSLSIGSSFLGRVASKNEDAVRIALIRGFYGVITNPVHKNLKVGDYVRVAVVSLDPSRGNQIELTDSPVSVNSASFSSGLDHFQKGNRVFGEISSVEDHGYVVRFTHNVTGFLPFKNLVSKNRLKKGEPISCFVESANAETRVLGLTSKIKETTYRDNGDISLSQLFPGMLVRVDVRSKRLNGFKCKLLNTFDVGLHAFDVDKDISVHEKINVRIMYSDLNSKVILVSALPSVVSMDNIELKEDRLKIGTS